MHWPARPADSRADGGDAGGGAGWCSAGPADASDGAKRRGVPSDCARRFGAVFDGASPG